MKYFWITKHLFYFLIALNFFVIKSCWTCFMTPHVNRFAMNNKTVYLYLIFNFQSTIKWSFQDLAHGKILTLPLIAACGQQHHLISKPNFVRLVDMMVSWLMQEFELSFKLAAIIINVFLVIYSQAATVRPNSVEPPFSLLYRQLLRSS